MRDLKGRVALITGASAGIGVHVARALAKQGMNLALAARRPVELEQVAAEMRAAGQNDYMPDWIKDYGGLRAQVRACQSVKH